MSETMLAVRNYGTKDYRLERLERPRAGPREAVIRIDAAGICGSDGKCYGGAQMFKGWLKTPVIPGHEFFGTVVELGEGAGEKWGIRAGDKVIAEQIVPCDECRFCKSGQYWMCERHDVYGFQNNVNGAMAKFMRLPATSRTHKVPTTSCRENGGDDRALCLLRARGEPRPDPARRLRRVGRRRAAWPLHGRRGAAEEPVEAGGARHQAGTAGDRQAIGADL